jgi:hypothetical protein
MTTLGFHYFPDDTHYRASDLQTWLPELKALGAHWLTLVGSLSRAVPESFVKGLVEAGIEPIIHLPVIPLRRLTPEDLEPLFRSYARWGVKYVALFSEPNLRTAWATPEWGKPGLVERFLDLLVPALQAQAEAGLQPVFPALRAGGDYWDTAFLEAALAGLSRRDPGAWVKQLVFAVNLWTFNRPVSWGEGGLQRWPEAKPYLTPPGTQDQIGFHLVDWYDPIIRDRLGQAHPFICLAGGPRLGDQTDKNFLPLDEIRHETCIRELLQAQANQALLPNLQNINLWLLAAPEGSPFGREAWYRGDGSLLPAVETLKHRLQVQAKAAKAVAAQQAAGGAAGPKPIRHYLLMPAFEWGISEWHWNAAVDFVKAFRPACGFSPEEAAHAQKVTILGNEQGISRDVEAMLRLAGCTVERVAGQDGPETAALLKAMAQIVNSEKP